ncbi:MAG: hypothetical protein VX913_04510, partial [Planctomycetota bacterium]|nr:hypothetical protein [Planctomycetota bacterium]
MRRSLLIACALLFASAAVEAQVKYRAKGAGTTTIRYSAPTYEGSLVATGEEWAMGIGRPTTMGTDTALVWPEGIVFPGQYTLAARRNGDRDWSLVVREDTGQSNRNNRDRRGGPGTRRVGNAGGAQNNQPRSGGQSFPMKQALLESKRAHAARMVIDFRADKDKVLAKAGGGWLRVRFGPHELTTRPKVLPIITKKGKLGEPYIIEFVGYPTDERLEELFAGEGKELTIGRLTLPKTIAEGQGNRGGRGARPRPARATLVLVPGETPELQLRGS